MALGNKTLDDLLGPISKQLEHKGVADHVDMPEWEFKAQRVTDGLTHAKLVGLFADEAAKIRVHFAAENEDEAIADIKQLLSFLPQNNLETAPFKETADPAGRVDDALNGIVPDNPNKAYDMYGVIKSIVDDGIFFEVHKDFAKNIIVGFAHMNGRSVGWTSAPAARPPVSCASATPSTFRSSPW